ncbi:MAG: hypothetical protein ABIP38_12155 [Steroidobacteraceae bacterium]
MNIVKIAFFVAGVVLLSGCTVTRGDCEFMLPTERERCLQANASSEKALRERAAALRKDHKPFTVQKDSTDPSRIESRAP